LGRKTLKKAYADGTIAVDMDDGDVRKLTGPETDRVMDVRSTRPTSRSRPWPWPTRTRDTSASKAA
jgi:hypothetical protein